MTNRFRYLICLLLLLLLGGATLADAACPTGCTCLTPSDAKVKGASPCGKELVLCGYDRLQNPMYCYTLPLTTTTPPTTCPSGCSCLNATDAKVSGYTAYCGGKQSLCGYDRLQNPMYCWEKPVATTTTSPTFPPCPDGCSCLNAADAKARGYSFCGGKETLCGYGKDQSPLFCYEPAAVATTTPAQSCPVGCSCMDVGTAEGRGYSYCGGRQVYCGATAAGAPQYCFQAEPLCPAGCECIDPSTATKMGISTLCGGERTACAVIGTEWYCYQLSAGTPCAYDYATGSCTGSCTTGQGCHLNTIQRDPTTGKVTLAECTCKAIPPTDTTPPFVDISQTPHNATKGERILLTVTADDPSGVGTIEILKDGKVVKECEKTETCTLEIEATGDTSLSPYTVRAEDEAQNRKEVNYSLRFIATVAQDFQRIRPPGLEPQVRLLFVPLEWDQTQAQFNEAVDQQVAFFTDSTPLRDCPDRISVGKLSVSTDNLAPFTGSPEEILEFVEGRGYNVANYDVIVGLINDTPSVYPVVGRSNGDNCIWVTNSRPSTDGTVFYPSCTAHELGHIYGLEDEYCSNPAGSTDCRCNDGDSAYCGNTPGDGAATGDVNWLDADLGCNPSGTSCCDDCVAVNYGVCCDGNINEAGGRCIMSWARAANPRSFCLYCREHLATVDILQCGPTLSRYMRVLDVRLLIYRNGSVMDEMVVLNEGRPSYVPDKGGAYRLRIAGLSANVIDDRSFDVSFSYEGPMEEGVDYRGIIFDPVPVNFRIPYSESMHSLELFKDQTRIFSKPLNLCQKNGICEWSENYLSCPDDCPLTTPDRLCLNSQDGECDPDCHRGVDPDCVTPTPATTRVPLVGVTALIALIVVSLLTWRRR